MGCPGVWVSSCTLGMSEGWMRRFEGMRFTNLVGRLHTIKMDART